MAESKKDFFDAFVETWSVKYDKAVECLIKDRDALLAFYDFPAEHWKYLRTTNVIESSFATVRHRTVRSKGCLLNKTALAMIFKLAEAAERSWAPSRRSQPVAENHPRCKVRRRNRGR
jgi:transposase-like protein